MGKLDGKVALITGAARGQGRAEAVRLAEEGADIVAVDICAQIATVPFALATEEDLEETVRRVEATGRRIVAATADTRRIDQLHAALERGVTALGRLDIAVANAGISSWAPAVEITEEQWDDVLETNLKGVWNTCKVAVPEIRRHGEGGALVLTSSVAGLHGYANLAAYTSAKHGLVGLMRVLGMELGPEKIRVNTIHPGTVNTPMLLNDAVYELFCPDMEKPTEADIREVAAGLNPMPTPWVEASDVANAVAFLVSDDARFITGATLPIDAGENLIN
ncbi:MAG: mycofactocin-coupled SDR family oxidoreductase [Actinobacteria bacterium]|nr:mycofactocin-coupled SDR family oxidoreductase [Actinomycetota bacterium]